MIEGKVTQWNDAKGFGFITVVSSKERLFFHISSFKIKGVRPETGQEVLFKKSKDAKGKFQAVDVKLKGQNVQLGQALKAFLFSALFLSALAVLSFIGNLPYVIFILYLIMSFVTFLLYGWDKLAAKKSWQRTPEFTLHWLSLMCGWPGAMYAQQLFRHKSYKPSFRRAFWPTVVLNFIGLIYLISPYGNWLMDKVNQVNVLELFQ